MNQKNGGGYCSVAGLHVCTIIFYRLPMTTMGSGSIILFRHNAKQAWHVPAQYTYYIFECGSNTTWPNTPCARDPQHLHESVHRYIARIGAEKKGLY